VDGITMDPKAIQWEGADWFDIGPISAKWRNVFNTAMKIHVP
jgi:hypothetical protein